MDNIVAMNIPEFTQNALKACISELDQVKDLFLRNPGIDFTRNRKITFKSFIECCLQMEGGALQNELLKYYSFDVETPTKSAFIQQRSKVLPEAFEFLFITFIQKVSNYLSLRTFQKYRVIAVDGSDINIPYNPSDLESFHQNGDKKGYNQLHLNVLHDVLNGFYVDAVLEPDKKCHERAAFIKMVDRNYIVDPCVYMGDRGYEGWKVFAHIIEAGQKFLIRLKDDDSNGILSTYQFDYDENHEFDQHIETILTWRQTNEIKAHPELYTYIARNNFDLFTDTRDMYPISIRVICIEVAPGKYEYLATNLTEKELSPEQCKALYHLRWNEETSFRDLKYTVDLLSFHCRKQEYVRQEIWAALTLFNFCEVIARSIVISKDRKEKRALKHEYLVNFSTAVCICKGFLRQHIPARNVSRLISRFVIPVRPGRYFERKIKAQSARLFLYRPA